GVVLSRRIGVRPRTDSRVTRDRFDAARYLSGLFGCRHLREVEMVCTVGSDLHSVLQELANVGPRKMIRGPDRVRDDVERRLRAVFFQERERVRARVEITVIESQDDEMVDGRATR